MAQNPYLFNLMLAATTRCNRAIIRLDTVHFYDETLSHNRPRITTQLLTVRRMNNGGNVQANMAHIEYQVSINGAAFQSMLYGGSFEVVKELLEHSCGA